MCILGRRYFSFLFPHALGIDIRQYAVQVCLEFLHDPYAAMSECAKGHYVPRSLGQLVVLDQPVFVGSERCALATPFVSCLYAVENHREEYV